MIQVTKILFLLLIVMFSCKRKNDIKTKTISGDKKTEIADTSQIRNKALDNYIVDYTSKQDSGTVYMFCENMPEFPGGENAFTDYLRSKIIYPPHAVSDKKEGRVVIKFIVRASGRIGDVQIIRSLRPDMDNECMRVISGMPEWKPGTVNNKPISVSYNITIRFLLKGSENLNGIYILPPKNSSVIPSHR